MPNKPTPQQTIDSLIREENFFRRRMLVARPGSEKRCLNALWVMVIQVYRKRLEAKQLAPSGEAATADNVALSPVGASYEAPAPSVPRKDSRLAARQAGSAPGDLDPSPCPSEIPVIGSASSQSPARRAGQRA